MIVALGGRMGGYETIDWFDSKNGVSVTCEYYIGSYDDSRAEPIGVKISKGESVDDEQFLNEFAGEIEWFYEFDEEGKISRQITQYGADRIDANYIDGKIDSVEVLEYVEYNEHESYLTDRVIKNTYDINNELSKISVIYYRRDIVHDYDGLDLEVSEDHRIEYPVKDGYITTGMLHPKRDYKVPVEFKYRDQDVYDYQMYHDDDDEYEYDDEYEDEVYYPTKIADNISPSERDIEEVTREIIEAQKKVKNKEVKE